MRLPEFQSTRAAPLRSLGPGAAVAEFRSRQGVAQAVFELGQEVAEQADEYHTKMANAAVRDEISDFNRDMATRVDFSADDVRQMELDDVVDIVNPETGEDLASIPKFKVYAAALERKMEDAIQRHGGEINNQRRRNAWANEVQEVARKEVDRAVERSAEMAQRDMVARKNNDLQAAILSGNYETAREVLADSQFRTLLGPEGVREAQNEITTAEVEQGFRNTMRTAADTGDVEGLKEFAQYLRDDKTNRQYGTLDDARLNQWADQADKMADAVERDAKARRDRMHEGARRTFYQQLHMKSQEGTFTAADLAGIDQLKYLTSSDVNTAWRMLNNQQSSGTPYAKSSNPKAYTRLSNALADGDQVAIARELETAAPLLKESDYLYFVKEAQKLRDTPSYQTNILSTSTILNGAYASMGMDPKSDDADDMAQVTAFQQAFTAEVERLQSVHGRELTTGETQGVVDKLTVRHKEDSGWWFGIGDFEGDVFDYVQQDLDDPATFERTIGEITDELRSNGLPVTSENIYRVYRATR